MVKKNRKLSQEYIWNMSLEKFKWLTTLNCVFLLIGINKFYIVKELLIPSSFCFRTNIQITSILLDVVFFWSRGRLFHLKAVQTCNARIMFPFDPTMCTTLLSWIPWIMSIDPTARHNLCIRRTACMYSGLVPAQPVIIGLSIKRPVTDIRRLSPGQILASVPHWDPGFNKFQQEKNVVPWIGEHAYTEI